MQLILFSNTAEILLHGYVMVHFKKDKKKNQSKTERTASGGIPHCYAHWEFQLCPKRLC